MRFSLKSNRVRNYISSPQLAKWAVAIRSSFKTIMDLNGQEHTLLICTLQNPGERSWTAFNKMTMQLLSFLFFVCPRFALFHKPIKRNTQAKETNSLIIDVCIV